MGQLRLVALELPTHVVSHYAGSVECVWTKKKNKCIRKSSGQNVTGRDLSSSLHAPNCTHTHEESGATAVVMLLGALVLG